MVKSELAGEQALNREHPNAPLGKRVTLQYNICSPLLKGMDSMNLWDWPSALTYPDILH